jgi:hypothetical protein
MKYFRIVFIIFFRILWNVLLLSNSIYVDFNHLNKNFLRRILLDKKKFVLNLSFSLFNNRYFVQEEMTRFVTELHTRPEISVKGAANSRLGKRLVSIFTTPTKSSPNQVS